MLASLVTVLLRLSVDGGLELAELDDVAAFHAAELAPCRNPKAAGAIRLELTIADGGVAQATTVRDSRPGAAACVTQALSQWQFPARAPTALRFEWSPGKKTGPEEPVEMPAPVDFLSERRGDVARCYLKNRRAPADEGPIEVDVTAGRSGLVLAATLTRVGTRFGDTHLGPCVVEAVRAWRFPPAKSLWRATLAWQLARKQGASPLGPGVVGVSDFERTEPTTADMPFHVAVLEHTPRLVGCSAATEALVSIVFRREPDGGMSTAALESNPPAPDVEDCVVARARSFTLPLDAGSHAEAWWFPGDGGVVAYQTTLFGTATTATGGLSKDAIMAVLKRHQNEVKFCYEQRLQSEPQLSGKVSVQFVIGPSGQVTDAGVIDAEPAMRQVSACVVGRIQRWKFPEPVGGGNVSVTFPWIFKPADREGD